VFAVKYILDYSKIYKDFSIMDLFMVAKGYSCVSIKHETAQRLRTLARKKKLKSIAKAIEYLVSPKVK